MSEMNSTEVILIFVVGLLLVILLQQGQIAYLKRRRPADSQCEAPLDISGDLQYTPISSQHSMTPQLKTS